MQISEPIQINKNELDSLVSSSDFENVIIPIETKVSCVVLKKNILIFHVTDLVKAVAALWKYATKELPLLFVSTQLNASDLLKDVYEYVYGYTLDAIDLRDKKTLNAMDGFFEDLADANLFINDSTKELNQKSIRNMMLMYEFKVIITDL